MFCDFTYQDWLKEPADKRPMIEKVIAAHKGHRDTLKALEAQRYFDGDNTAINSKVMLKVNVREEVDDKGRTKRRPMKTEVAGARIPSAFFRTAVMQENQYLLSNGVLLDEGIKERLGIGFDTALENIGEKALIQGVCYGFWNADHIEAIPMASDPLSGCAVLLDEIDGMPKVAIQYWQINPDRPKYIRVFEHDGITIYRQDDRAEMVVEQDKRNYVQTILSDGAGDTIIGGRNYDFLPIIPFYANNEKRSELSSSIKAKIDAYDRIISDFSDNLDRANDVYWALNNFGGSLNEALQTQQYINELKLVVNQNDGTGGGASAEPHTVDVPYAAREKALELLKKALYVDYMAVDMDAMTGGSLTNVAIKATMANLDMKASRYEWQAFAFVQSVLKLLGIETENIVFRRQTISNDVETVQAIYTMRSDIDIRTALELNPYINADDIDTILNAVEVENKTGLSSVEELKKYLDEESDTE